MLTTNPENGSDGCEKRTRILVVEDERIVAEDLSMSLQELGYDVPAILESAEEVIARASEIAPDLILMDVMLGGKLDGVEAAERLAAIADIPVIFLTAHADDATFQRAKRSEPLGYLLKPFDVAQLRHTIEMALYKHSLDARLKESEHRYREKLEGLVRQRTIELEAANKGLLSLNRELERQRSDAERARFEAEAANRAKSEFLAGMSHELRTPLTAVIGFAEVLRDQHFGSLGGKQVEYVGNIIDSGRHLLEIINDILDLAKVESGSDSLDLRLFSLKGFLTSCISLVGERARRNGITLNLEMADDAMVEADPRKLKQVMINLLGNALKFTPEGGTISIIVEVRLDAMTTTTSGAGAAREVVIMVRDTGIGIRPDDMPHLFEKFTQFEHSLTRRHEGTGLGLALAKQLVELHGGTIRVQSKVGFGSTFSVTIPVRQDMEKG
jgi:signal transduction histidine kinase